MKNKFTGVGIGEIRGEGRVLKILSHKEFGKVKGGEVVVTKNATPDFILILNKINCLITDEGGMTSHIAIICRELNIPAILGTGKASSLLKNDQKILFDTSIGSVFY